MITIIDYGMGNVGSIVNMLKYMDFEVKVTCDSNEILNSDKIILPGVGSFDYAMTKLHAYNLYETIREYAIVRNKPILGICLGMQILGKRSEEGVMEGLGLLDFENVKFEFSNDSRLKIPHMGWDIVEIEQKHDLLVENLTEVQRYYFVHSYHAICHSKDISLMLCDYGYKFTAAVVNRNIYGVQFHPEKSHKFGMNLLRNFANIS